MCVTDHDSEWKSWNFCCENCILSSITREMGAVRASLGLCPQHNMLFEDLNVTQHLVFFAMLKGTSRSEAYREAARYISLLNLTSKGTVIVTNLSGGMKRKVGNGQFYRIQSHIFMDMFSLR